MTTPKTKPTPQHNTSTEPPPFDAVLHCRCYAEEKAAWIQAAKASPQRKLTDWVKTQLNHASTP